MNILECRELSGVRDDLLTTLTEAMAHRQARGELVETPFGPESAWIGFERQTMCEAVNRHRTARGLGPIDEARVWRVEQGARGHADYAAKMAIYCAELAVGAAALALGAAAVAGPAETA